AQAQRLDLPSMALGVARIHPEQLAGEERGLLAACAGTDLQQHVALVVGIARSDRSADALFELGLAALERRQLGLGQLAQLGVIAFEHRAMLGDVVERSAILANRADHFLERGALARDLCVLAVVVNDRRIAQSLLELSEALFDSFEFVEHQRRAVVRVRQKFSAAATSEATAPARPIPRPPGRMVMRHGQRELQCYFRPYLRLKRSTRPAVSTSRCWPV